MSTSAATMKNDRPSQDTGGLGLPLESWFILLLGALSVGLLGAVVGEYAVDTDPAVMAMLATAAYVFGYALAGTLLPDIVAHLLSFLAGIVVALVALDPQLLWEQLRAGAWREVIDRYQALLSGFWSSLKSGERFETEIAVFAIGLTIWLVAYSASWMLFRRGWIFWSLALPGAIMLVTMALDRDRPNWPALVYLGLALVMAATHTAIIRRATWRSRAIPQPSSLGRRSILLGSIFAALAVGIGLYYSFDLDDRLKDRAFDNTDRVASWISDRFDQSDSAPTGPQPASGTYAAFADQFKIGEGVPSGNDPLVIVQADAPEYLAARRLDAYDGSGWKSTTALSDGDSTPPPRMAFQPDQPMNMPREQLQHRSQDQASILIMLPTTDNLLFTIDQHYSASVPTFVRVGWADIDETYDVANVDLATVPVDLRDVVILLGGAEFSDPNASSTPELQSETDRAEYMRLQERLHQYPVTTELSWSETGTVLAHFEGRVPIYSDIEAVLGNEDMTGMDYSVVGLAPSVTANELTTAGADYPAYITDTYLPLPDTVTQETRDLAGHIVTDAGASTPYDMAIAIQNYLRSNFTYQVAANPVPEGEDLVDYFLFESKTGRCDHYASSMIVMLRMLGVPSRIVIGFPPVAYDDDLGGYVYRGRNAHAWVEVYFPGYGWIPFEPTPSQQAIGLDQQAPAPEPTPSPTSTPASTAVSAGTPLAPSPTPTSTPLPAPVPADANSSNGQTGGISPWVLGGIAAASALLAAGGLFLYKRRNLYAGLPVTSANYGRLQRLGRYFGIRAAPELTPREYAIQVGAARPQSAAGAMKVADAFTQAQYATNVDAGTIAQDSELGWKEARAGTTTWRFWRR